MKMFGAHLGRTAAVVLTGALAISCADSEATLIAPRRPARPEHCPVQLFPTTHPSYPSVDLASVRATCDNVVGRDACIEQLRMQACAVGGDTVYGFSEGVNPAAAGTVISATVALRGEAPSAGPSSLGNAAPAGDAADAGCTPICSPGFACRAGQCIPQCNPACEPTEICNRHRTCEPASAAPAATK
jgi:hypothetical protein